MPSLAQRVLGRYVREKAQKDPSERTSDQQDSVESAQILQSVQAADDTAGARRGRSSVLGSSKSLISKVLESYRLSKDPDPDDVEVNGAPPRTQWDEDAVEDTDEDSNEDINREAVRKAVACLMNDPLQDPEPTEGGCGCGGNCGGNCGCGNKHAKLETVDMIGATRDDEFLGAVDANKAGARSPYYWKVKVGGPFDLYLLRRVPLDLAEQLVDFGSAHSRLRKGRDVWRKIKRYASSRPFKSLLK